jgi:hypothetical protein
MIRGLKFLKGEPHASLGVFRHGRWKIIEPRSKAESSRGGYTGKNCLMVVVAPDKAYQKMLRDSSAGGDKGIQESKKKEKNNNRYV